MTDYTPTPKLPDFFAPKPTSGALTYTPTTEEVRLAVTSDDEAWIVKAEFDRWLAEVKAQERKAEHERIVEAIKPLISKGYFPPEEVGAGDWLEVEFSELATLIKGEEQ